jgi:hypothetical protein
MKDQKEPSIGDDAILTKYKLAKVSDDRIAAKLGLSVEQVNQRWERILDRASRMTESGYGHLVNQFGILCHQYQLLGESLKPIAEALGNIMPLEEVERLIVGKAEDVALTLKNLARSCIILRPFTPVNPVEALEQQTENIQRSN